MSEVIELRILNEQIAELRALLLLATGCNSETLQQATFTVLAQLDERRQELAAPKATVSLSESCEQMGARCGKQDEDARIDMRSFRFPTKWRCVGCREEFEH